jgi:hypothetical protein
MFAQTEIELIEKLRDADPIIKSAKTSCIKLSAIRIRVTGEKEKECFCSQVRRRIWIKDFYNWYDSITK